MGYGDLRGITLENSDQILGSVMPSKSTIRAQPAGRAAKARPWACGPEIGSHASHWRVSTAGSGASALRPFAGGLSTSSAAGDETHFCPVALPRKTLFRRLSVPDAAQPSFAFAEGPRRRGMERILIEVYP